MHIDDFLWAGSDRFKQDVISPLRSRFCCGKELDSSFRYIGLDIEQADEQIYLSQTDYTEELKQVDRDIYPSDVKNKVCVQIVGQLQWIATQSRPDPFFDVLVLATYCD